MTKCIRFMTNSCSATLFVQQDLPATPRLENLSKVNDNSAKKPLTKFDIIWTKKLSRFIGLVLNGGLTDFKLNFDEFIRKVYDQCQNTNNDIDTLCYNTINLKEITKIIPTITNTAINEETIANSCLL